MKQASRLLSDVPFALSVATSWLGVLWLFSYPVDHWPVVASIGFVAAYSMLHATIAVVMIVLTHMGRHLKRINAVLERIRSDTCDCDTRECKIRDDDEYSPDWRIKATTEIAKVCVRVLPAGLSVFITANVVGFFGAPSLPTNLVIGSIWVSISSFVGIMVYFGWTVWVIYRGWKFLADRAGVATHTTIPFIDGWIEYWRRRDKSVTDVSAAMMENNRVAFRVGL